MSGENKSLTRRPGEYLFPRHSPPQGKMDTAQLEELLERLVGRRLIGWELEGEGDLTALKLEFEGGVWLRYSDIVVREP